MKIKQLVLLVCITISLPGVSTAEQSSEYQRQSELFKQELQKQFELSQQERQKQWFKAQSEKTAAAIKAQSEKDTAAIKAQSERNAAAIKAQSERNAAAIKAQSERNAAAQEYQTQQRLSEQERQKQFELSEQQRQQQPQANMSNVPANSNTAQATKPPAQKNQPEKKNVVMGRYPISGSVSQDFGVPWSENSDKTHTGVDIPAQKGTVVPAMTSGNVVLIGNLGGDWGKYVIVEEPSGTAKGYLHITPSVSFGKSVNPGDEIGKVYKDHLHYNVCRTKSYCQRGALPTIKKDTKHPNDPFFKDGPFVRP